MSRPELPIKRFSTRIRWTVYGLTLAGALLAGRWADGQDEQVRVDEAESRPAPRIEPASSGSLPTLDLAVLGTRTTSSAKGDLFPATSWEREALEAARRSAPPPPRPPRPRAPPLPFTYMGKMIDGSGTVVFLIHGDRNLIVRAGDTLAGTYRVESIEAESMVLTYLPLREAQSLPLRGAGATIAMPGGAAPAAINRETGQ